MKHNKTLEKKNKQDNNKRKTVRRMKRGGAFSDYFSLGPKRPGGWLNMFRSDTPVQPQSIEPLGNTNTEDLTTSSLGNTNTGELTKSSLGGGKRRKYSKKNNKNNKTKKGGN